MAIGEFGPPKSTSKLIGLSLVSRLYIGVLNLATLPLLLALVGIEAFGLIGLSVIVQSVFSIMDSGLGSAVGRALARTGSDGQITREAVTAGKGIERFYWLCVPIVLGIAYLSSIAVASDWDQSSQLTDDQLFRSLLMLSGSIAAQWLLGFYNLALLGLRCAHDVAILNAATWTLRLGGGVAIAIFTRGSIVWYFAWQFATATLSVVIFCWALRRRAPMWSKIQAEITGGFRVLGKTAISISILSTCFLVFNQVDKVIVGTMFSLEVFGYYSLAWQLASALYLLYNPVYSVYLPILSSAFHRDGTPGLVEHAKNGTLLLSLLVGPVAAITIVFSEEILFIWTGNRHTAEMTSGFLALAFAGASVSSLLFVVYGVQIAVLRTELTLKPISIALACMFVVMFFAIRIEDPMVIVSIWVFFNFAYVSTAMSLTAIKILKVDAISWCLKNIVGPIVPCVIVTLTVKYLVPSINELDRVHGLLIIVLTYIMAFCATLGSNKSARYYCLDIWRRRATLFQKL